MSLSADELASKTGLYRLGSEEDHIVSITVRDGRLTLRDFYGDNYDMPMTPISPSRFLIAGTPLEFSPAEAGRPQAWHVIDGGGRSTDGASVDEVRHAEGGSPGIRRRVQKR